MMHQPYSNGAPNLVAPYHPMVYPAVSLVNTGSHPQVSSRPHFFPSSALVQPFNNTQVQVLTGERGHFIFIYFLLII